MAAKATKKSGAALEKLRADIKSGSPENVYIFYGEETYLRDRYLEELKALLVPEGFEEFNYHRLSGKGLTVQDLTEVVEDPEKPILANLNIGHATPRCILPFGIPARVNGEKQEIRFD